MEIIIDISEFKKYSKGLKEIHKSAFPIAVRQSLTEAAKVTKTKTLPYIVKNVFEKREANFFKANSTYKPAEGFKLHRMQSSVGMYENKLHNKSTNYAVKDLEAQESGGKIGGKSMIPMKTARAGKSTSKRVQNKNRVNSIKKNRFTMVLEGDGRSKKQQFIRAAAYSISKGDGYVLGSKTKSGGRTLFKIDFIRSGAKNKKFQMKFTPLYNIKKRRKINIARATNFMEKSAILGAKSIPKKYRNEATRLYTKYLNPKK